MPRPRPRARVRSEQQTGVLTGRRLEESGVTPPPARLAQGPVVMVECVENIPCNPCASACPRKAISVKGGLTGLPRVAWDKCNGCTMCVARCPGLAIFVVDRTFSKVEVAVTLPCELMPRPAVGDRVAALDRAGRKVATARVVKVLQARALDRCAVVTVAVPKRLWNDVRGIRP
jgi:Fe-S-cluster-containing hydrogenase component 2